MMETATGIDLKRIAELQEGMNARIPTICPQRAEILTGSFMQTEGEPIVIRRAKAFAEILSRMSVYIENGMLIIGNRLALTLPLRFFPNILLNGSSMSLTVSTNGRGIISISAQILRNA